VIVISLVVIGLVGIVAIWGGDIARMVIEVSRGEPAAPELTPEPPQPALPPGGVPAGPF
jgi:hypothetical protein